MRLAEQRFGDFIRKVVNPGALERDVNAASLDSRAYRLACSLGMTSFSLPEDVGGDGENAVSWGRLLERIGYTSLDCALPFVVSLRASVIKAIYRSGRKDLTDRYVRPMVCGARVPAFAYTDGTECRSSRMRAAICNAFTGPEDLRLGEIEEPKPADDEILIGGDSPRPQRL